MQITIFKRTVLTLLMTLISHTLFAMEPIDLTKNDLYARQGFDVKWTTQSPSKNEIQTGQWKLISGVESGGRSLLVKDIFEESKQQDFKPKAKSFTFVTSFDLKTKSYNEQEFIGLFLTTIGNQWEIYVNGRLLRREVDLNALGQADSYNFMRDVLIQLDKRNLLVGKNIIAYHFIKTLNNENTGLYNSNSYLIGNYKWLKGKQTNLSSVVLSFTYLIIGLFFLFMYLRRKKGLYNLVFSITCIFLFVYLISRTYYIREYISDSLTISKIEYIALFLFSGLAVAFYDLILGYFVSKFAKIYTLICTILSVLVLFGNINSIDQYLLAWQLSAIFSLSYILFYRVLYEAIKVSVEYQKSLMTDEEAGPFKIFKTIKHLIFTTTAGNLMIGTVLFSITSGLDIFDSVNGGTGVFGFKYGFFIFMIGNAGVLINKFVKAQIQVEDLMQNLGEKVAERTISLELSNKELENARDHAKESNKAKGEFLANMSHEIRTPINGVIGMLNMLNDTKLTEKQKEFSHTASASASSLLGLINDILDFSKIEAGKLELEKHIFNTRELFNNFNQLVSLEIEEKGITYKCNINNNVPTHLIGDDNRLRQILLNLTNNAKKFTSKGSITLSISLNESQNKNGGNIDDISQVELLFSVKDSGIGISKENKNQLFDKFTQADKSTTRKYGGTGLGLAISKQLVKAMGGEINIVSELGKGSEFYFTGTFEIPTKIQTKLALESDNNKLNRDELDLEKLALKKVLVAEDNLVNQMVIKGLLKKYNISPTIVNNGLEVLEVLKKEKFHIIFMDLQMPEMDGLETTKVIRSNADDLQNKDITIVAVTANAMKGDVEQCLDAGMNDYLSKPILVDKMTEVILKWLN